MDHDVDDDLVEDDSDFSEDDDYYTDEDSDLDASVAGHDSVPRSIQKSTPLHAKHWTDRVSSQMCHFRKHVHAAMMTVFKATPSLELYSALLASSTDPEATEDELIGFLERTSLSCPEAFVASLNIHVLRRNTMALAQLLSSHSHLLRPRDALTFQSAVLTLSTDAFQQQRALNFIEKEMLDCARATRAALAPSFSRFDAPENLTEMERILKLRPSTPGRQDRIERWVDAISTPGANNPNPVALAAMVMGLPIVPALDGTEDGDMFSYLDIDPNDPDMEDLREEFRPKLKQRFEGWSDTAIQVKGSAPMLVQVYNEIVKSMAFLRASDMVEEVVGR